MKAVIVLKEIGFGQYEESPSGVEYTRSDAFQKTYSALRKENDKLRERVQKRDKKIEELTKLLRGGK
jgi:hypothetical protein